MMRLRKAATAIAAIFLVTLGGKGSAQDSAELRERIQERSTRIREFRALLNDPDQVVRLAALDEMLKSKDVAMQELGYGVCFASADQAMRAVCLKNKLAQMESLTFRFTDDPDRTEKEASAISKLGGAWSIVVRSFDESTGQLVTQGGRAANAPKGSGQVSGSRLDVDQAPCKGSLELKNGGVLTGELACTVRPRGIFPVELRLQ